MLGGVPPHPAVRPAARARIRPRAHAQSFGAMVSPKVPAAVAAPTPDPRVRPPVLRGACPARPPVPAFAVFCTPRRRCPASGARIVCVAPGGPVWAPSLPVFAKCIAKMLSAILGETPPTFERPRTQTGNSGYSGRASRPRLYTSFAECSIL